jgi:hypothetical protein
VSSVLIRQAEAIFRSTLQAQRAALGCVPGGAAPPTGSKT